MSKYTVVNYPTAMSESMLNETAAKYGVLCVFTYDPKAEHFVYVFSNFSKADNEVVEAEVEAPQQQATPATPTRFMFKSALIALGVKPSTADDWIKVRKAKRAAQTETAFTIIAKQIKIGMDNFGVTADDIIRVAIDRNWQGLRAEWLDNVDWSSYGVTVGHTDLPFMNDENWQ